MRPVPNKLSTASLKSDEIFKVIVERVKSEPEKAKAVNAVILYNVTQGGKQVKQWTMDLKEGVVYEGAPKNNLKPHTTLTISDDDFVLLASGKLNPQAAFMKGKLRIAGNIMAAQKLGPLLKSEAKL